MSDGVRGDTEAAFEETIVASMLAGGWSAGRQEFYDPDSALDTAHLFEFIGASQMDAWSTLVSYAGGDRDLAQREFVRLLAREIDERGALDVLRNGVKDRGVRIQLAYFRPAHTVAEDALREYRTNRLSVTRQLHYSPATPHNSVDLALFVNGIPVATAELKSAASQQPQTVEDAKEQYRRDRDPADRFFARRTLVHFAVDEDMVFLTTRLRSGRTAFLPFNQGTEGPGNAGGAGNPELPAGSGPAYRTSYLWERVWQPDAWLDLLKRFLHVEDVRSARARGRGGNGRTSVHARTLIFPRYHQWHAVRELTAHAARHGSGHNYLVMHSAGSGKSNTIGWLAHRLSTLHGSAEPGALDPEAVAASRIEVNRPVFHKVVVVTDRSVLDKQLQDTIFQFDHTPGVVERITGSGGSKSAEVAAALANTATKIVIVTVQTFPYVLEGVGSLADRRIAVVVDEAHSGQSGDSLAKLRKVLRGLGAEDIDEDGDPLTSSALARQRHPNLSYFAFTATPKHKTLELFGIRDPATGELRAFHIYSMRQAIEEEFILDVLRNYTTYQTYWRVAKEGADEIEVNPKKAGAQLARLVYLNPATLDAHAEVIVHHFQTRAAGRLGGRAKAMVVTRSRESAVRMFYALRRAADDLGWTDLGILVAFSGELELDGVRVTESGLNGISERELPDAFAYTRADDPHAAARTGRPGGAPARTEYRILVVADKYQTGFDQPLLTSMYVEKPLAGVAAVQTLSRLNRTHPLKSQDDLFVLDFANDADDIQAAFKPYFEEAYATPTDPNLLYDDQRAVMEHQILIESELQEFVEAYLRAQPAGRSEGPSGWDRRHAALYQLTDPARQRFQRLAAEDRDAAELFRSDLHGFVRKYGFLSQVMQFVDPELERLYLFGRHLLNRLPRRRDPAVDIGEVDLTHLRVSKTGEHDMALEADGGQLLPGFDSSSAGSGPDPDKVLLSEIIEAFNQRFGLGLSDADRLKYEERIVAAADDPAVEQAAVASRNEADFELPFNARFRDIMIERAEADTKLTERFFADNEFQGRLTREARRAAYRMIRRRHGLPEAA